MRERAAAAAQRRLERRAAANIAASEFGEGIEEVPLCIDVESSSPVEEMLIDLTGGTESDEARVVHNPFSADLACSIPLIDGRQAAAATGAIPKRLGVCPPMRVEVMECDNGPEPLEPQAVLQESIQSERELEEYLIGDGPAVPIPRAVAIDADDWNSVKGEPIAVRMPPMWQEVERRAPSPRPRLSKSARRRAHRQNPNRQWTVDDYVPGWVSPVPSELPDPPCRPPTPHAEERCDERAARVRRMDRPEQGERVAPGRARAHVWNEPAPAERREPAQRQPPTKRRGIIFGNLAPVPTDPTVDPPPFACFNCWR